ncbi:hypothetical protein [Marinilabilia sp.]|uniref:hypothetical protein n=1 Tax=Marinilabilia sp. TaxID=2021252 RepID=UPI0025B8C62B|nr:hypothetical protein [Marinilabilia sp.]
MGRSDADGAFIGLKALLNLAQRTALGHWKNYHYRPERAVREIVKSGFDSN